ncbi:MAG: pyridoxal-phosphate dependent enzyme [Bacteroidetes bacterium]|nr:pyridoxal-phosphate dependent enzyme [Bacteroidota bacterium]
MENKFHLRCRQCNRIINNFREWFAGAQKCPECGNKWVNVGYSGDYKRLKELISDSADKAENMFHYFDFLPLNDKKNIITEGEGVIPVDRWEFLEEFAFKKYGLRVKVLAYRNDNNYGTGTFKDAAAALVASVLKENGVKQYAVASTGNVANAFAHYLALAGISLTVFVPQDALVANEAGVGSYGQRVYRVRGDYHKSKMIAAEYSKKYGILLSGGNTDPMRVEAKKTMVFEWLRLLGYLPDVYIQALSGGTGPIAIEKGCDDIEHLGLFTKRPRYILVQPDKCDPMTVAWNKARSKGFPEGWESDYPVLENPETLIPTLATGNPITYPIIATIVHRSGGEIISFHEEDCPDVARLIAYETTVKIGPAAAIAIGGFFDALRMKQIREGESVMINVGEGARRAPELLGAMTYTTQWIDSVDETQPTDRAEFRNQLWKKFEE